MVHCNYNLSLKGRVKGFFRTFDKIRGVLMKKHDKSLFQIGEVTKKWVLPAKRFLFLRIWDF